jgi:hypothetical protein
MSQVLFAGGYPFHYEGNEWANAWWHLTTSNSGTWDWVPYFETYALEHYPFEFEVRDSADELEAADVILLDLVDNDTFSGYPDGIPDHVRVVVDDSGSISQNQADYTDGCGGNLEIPSPTTDILINQHCVDRWHVAWDYGLTGLHGKTYLHVID